MERLAEQVDVILVIGGRKSSNTARLAEVALGHGVESYHIESERDIQPEWLVDARDVGITAGASTPDDVIERVIDDLAARGYSRPSAHTWEADLDLEYEPAY
jgi:4-hydroxy-3-methylbut-2-en-1-yl diphosphate reductase